MSDELTLTHDGNLYANFSRGSLLGNGVPEAAVAGAERFARRDLIKAECRKRIYKVASSEAQINISGAATVASAKTTSQRSAEETALLATYALSLQWIMDMRAAVETLSADAEADYLSDASWPVCPVEVIALAGQF